MEKTLSASPQKSSAAAPFLIAAACALVVLACLAIPIYVIRPFRPQGPHELQLALLTRGVAPWLSLFCAFAALIVLLRYWPRVRGVMARIGLVSLTVLVIAGAVLARINIFEIMFHPYDAPAFGPAPEVKIDADDKVLAVRIGSEAHAYPIRAMAYHHIVNDTVGGDAIAATYCSLCHTGLIWSRLLDGQTLHFRLAGINNGNALMRDEETSSIWQQSTGEAIFGPLRGKQLTLVHSDELTYATWQSEEPQGLLLKPDAPYASEYETKDWEAHIEKRPTVVDTSRSGIGPHELMLGITLEGQSKAFPVKVILAEKLIQDQVADKRVLILVGPDKASIRVFEVPVPSGAAANSSSLTFVTNAGQAASGSPISDSETGSQWNFEGCAIDGKLKGRCLTRLDANKDYWFDWLNHHPKTAVFKG